MKNISILDVKRGSAPSKQQRQGVEVVKIEKAFSKAARQGGVSSPLQNCRWMRLFHAQN